MVLGDQLDSASAALSDFDFASDVILMIEAASEARFVWSHKARIAIFLSAMRHFAIEQRQLNRRVDYIKLGSERGSLIDILKAKLIEHAPRKLVLIEPGEYRLEQAIIAASKAARVTLALREDTHFLASRRDFRSWAQGSKQLRMEFFYRRMRFKTAVLMQGDRPEGGEWNYDHDNRGAFGKAGPAKLRAPLGFKPDAVTQQVIAEVEQTFPDHPGSLSHFKWPVTRADGLRLLADFIEHRLPHFGQFQDAMWSNEATLYHSLLSAALNLKLLNPREVIDAALKAYREKRAGIASTEGFIRQILGWREFIRGVYWQDMPRLLEANHYGHQRCLPKWYWTGETDMNCMRQVITMTLTHGYSHHIQRLMVTGMFGILAEINPRELHQWYLAMYVDAVEWVEAPNTLGMALYANGGRYTSKPYIASGAYINRMSNFCLGCRFKPNEKTGPMACPISTLYWNFLDKHEASFSANPRMALMIKNLHKLPDTERAKIKRQASILLNSVQN